MLHYYSLIGRATDKDGKAVARYPPKIDPERLSLCPVGDIGVPATLVRVDLAPFLGLLAKGCFRGLFAGGYIMLITVLQYKIVFRSAGCSMVRIYPVFTIIFNAVQKKV